MTGSQQLILGEGAGGSGVANYIEDVFSTWLYAGNGSTQTITNGIDLSTKGGLVWTKQRSGVEWHFLVDTARGATNCLSSNSSNASSSFAQTLTAFNTTGYNIGNDTGFNGSGSTYASWTFRKQAKFFDVVTYTGDAGSNRAVAHNLGSVPGCIIVKSTSDAGTNWAVYHRSLGDNKYVRLNTTAASATAGFFPTVPTATEFYVGNFFDVNSSGVLYVAYLFAHNAGGFGLTGTDNVISCGAFDIDGAGNATVNLGYEPQFVIIKSVEASSGWGMFDNMRGMPVSGNVARLQPNSSGAELEDNDYIVRPTATGFVATATGFTAPSVNGFIYIAIRRGPMKTPTSGTSVFSPNAWAGNDTTGRNIPTGFPVDLTVEQIRTSTGAIQANLWFDRLRGYSSTAGGNSIYLRSQNTDAESPVANYNYVPTMDGFNFGSVASSGIQYNGSSITAAGWNFRRAPGFFDEVCYRGNSASTQEISHNLTVRPEMIILKSRDTSNWGVMAQSGSTAFRYNLNSDLQGTNTTIQITDFSTTSVIYVGSGWWLTDSGFNASGTNYVAYLFASCPGVSKVGSYTGNGSSQTINCGFTGGARFIMIKRTDNTAGWYVYDSARGITSGNDPYLLMNSTAAEVTGTNYVDTASTGFQLVTGATAVNGNGASYIFLAIA